MLREQRNDYVIVSLQTIIYGVTLFYVTNQIVYPGSVIRSYIGIAMILFGALCLAATPFNRWWLQGHLLIGMTILWSLVTVQYFIAIETSSGWVLMMNMVIYCIRILWKGDWRGTKL